MKQPILELIIKAMPYPEHITDIEIAEDGKSVRFTWRSETRFLVGENYLVEEVGDGVLIGSDKAILVRRLLEQSDLLTALSKK